MKKLYPFLRSTLALSLIAALALANTGCEPSKLSASDDLDPLSPGDRWEPKEAVSGPVRKRLAPAQERWLEIAEESFEELDQIWKKSRNRLARGDAYGSLLADQQQAVQALVGQVQREGIRDWPMVFDETGLHFAPGLVARPLSSQVYRVESGHALTVPLQGSDFYRGGIPLAEMHPSARQVIAELAPGDVVYVSMPPGTFSLQNLIGGPPIMEGMRLDNPNYINQQTVDAKWIAACLDRAAEGKSKPGYDLCYVPVYLETANPEYLRISRSKTGEGFEEAEAAKRQAEQLTAAEIAALEAEREWEIQGLADAIAAHAWEVYQDPTTPNYLKDELRRWADGFAELGSGSDQWSPKAPALRRNQNRLISLLAEQGHGPRGEKWRSLFEDDYRLITIARGF